ncbi:Protein of unknown function [Hymenobacter daecheongensis DSM 21074]|uniref:DUF2971 domain-containing protein n=1 Tax=Hymenobacter daecheongensis DSM 21074 TaxID=1121955 RepID=A0A1M6HNN4_9BACT|nr:DUF2971 domain-containing protein [Hymenobacter daecheongensis]SHJ23736.1 Protein of unknown function [Hymenobacter daecheongensis DSM 21074]
MTEQDIIDLGILYKYRDACYERNWGILENQELYFPTPSSFNDPFDSNILIRFDLVSEDEQRKIVADYIRAKYPNEGSNLRAPRVAQVMESMNDPEQHDRANKTWTENLTQHTRMFCVCPDRGNILLWSHYGNNHSGFAIGFDPKEMLQVWKDNQGFLLGRVRYEDEYPVILPPKASNALTKQATLIKMLNVKSSIWAYEKEVRLTMFKGPEKAAFKSELITEVVLGCKISDDHQQRLLKLMDERYPHATVLKVKLRRGEFALDFDQLRG